MAVAIREFTVDRTGAAPAPASGALPPALSRRLPALHQAMRLQRLPEATRLGQMAAYHLGWCDAQGRPDGAPAGKLLRGSLCLWAAESYGLDTATALPVATAVEWIHNFTLVHDDIQDGDRQRRHRATVWAVWGAEQAINAGDGLHALAYEVILSGRGRPQRRLRAARALNRGVLTVIEGQCLDLDLEGRIDSSTATYLRLAAAKTGALIGAALEAAALLAGVSTAATSRLRRAGTELGVVFQIRDDWLGTWGDSRITGKAAGADLARRKVTFPVVVAHERLRGAARAELRRLYASPGPDQDQILTLLDAAGAEAGVAEALRRRQESAVALASRCGLPSDAIDDFAAIVAFAAGRTA